MSLDQAYPQFKTEASATVFKWDGTRMDAPDIGLEPYSFRNPGFLSQADLRQLGISHEKFVQRMSARLSTFLRMECVVKIRKLSSMTFAKFTETIESPTHVTLFQVEPLRGVGVLDMSLPLALSIADRVLGGRGRVVGPERGLTEIEGALVEDVIQLILGEWSHQWTDNNWSFQSRCIGTDTSGRFLQTSAPEAVTLAIDFEVALGDCLESMQMGLPFSMIEVIVKKMQQARIKGNESRAKKMEWRQPYEDIAVQVIAEWPVREVAMREVVNLRVGDLLEMPASLVDNTVVLLSNTPEFIGTAGIENGRMAVRLTQHNTKKSYGGFA
jgi:flagellar motor switch protein FliM